MARSKTLHLPVLTQVRYFSGQTLSAADLEQEQSYHRERVRLHNRLLHGAGVVAGLEVTAGRSDVVITPGMALDPVGDEIVVTCEHQIALTGLLRDSAPRFVVARHITVLREPIPVLGQVGDEVAFSRLEHGATVTIDSAEPSPSDAGVTLARLSWRSGRWRVDARFRRRKVKH